MASAENDRASKESVAELEQGDLDLLIEAARGAVLIFENAEALYREAVLLASVAAKERSLALHQISLEECAKLEMLGALSATVLMGAPVNRKKFFSAFANHRAKNNTNSYFEEVTTEEASARAAEDWEAANQYFIALQASFHQQSNNAKNAAFYTDYSNETFISPAQQITSEMLSEFKARNEKYLGIAARNANLIQNCANDPNEYKGRMSILMNGLESSLEAPPSTALRQLESLIEKMTAEIRSK
jgi:AbiV family abortive infection protein